MKKTSMILFSAFVGLLSSCSSDEVKSSYNEIESFEVAGVNGQIGLSNVTLFVFSEEDSANLVKQNVEPQIRISKNSTLSTGSGHWTEENFFTVTAENGETRRYSVRVVVIRKEYAFEDWVLSGDTNGYYVPSGSNSSWTSGNEGISWALLMLQKDSKDPENYPTKKTAEGKIGNAVLLETMEGGTVAGRKKPLLSGNFILGNFNMAVAIKNELAATEVGQIYPAKPQKIIGYYKYTEGDSVYISGEDAEKIPGRPDSCSMIVKFYKSDLPGGRDTTLTVENIDESELVIAETRKEDCSATEGEGFYPFELVLEYKSGKEELNFQKHRYKLGITFASSKDGDTFSGKIGSRLIIDEIEIIDEE